MRKEIGPAQVKSCLKPVKLALELNDIELSWKKLMRLLPSARRISPDREYKVEEIRHLLSVTSLHLRVSIPILAAAPWILDLLGAFFRPSSSRR